MQILLSAWENIRVGGDGLAWEGMVGHYGGRTGGHLLAREIMIEQECGRAGGGNGRAW